LLLEADYGFDLRKKYWLDVQLTDRRNPVPANIARHQYLFHHFFLAKRTLFFRIVLYMSTGGCTRGQCNFLEKFVG
jgi:hypothetical protein